MNADRYFGTGDYNGLGYSQGNLMSLFVSAPRREEEYQKRVQRRADMPKYCDPCIPYDQRGKRYYAAKYCLIFRRLAKIADELKLDWREHASMSNKAMGYNIAYDNTFED